MKKEIDKENVGEEVLEVATCYLSVRRQHASSRLGAKE